MVESQEPPPPLTHPKKGTSKDTRYWCTHRSSSLMLRAQPVHVYTDRGEVSLTACDLHKIPPTPQSPSHVHGVPGQGQGLPGSPSQAVPA